MDELAKKLECVLLNESERFSDRGRIYDHNTKKGKGKVVDAILYEFTVVE